MNWLLTASSEKSAAPYLEWLRVGGVHGAGVWSGNPVPAASGFDALLLGGGGDVAPRRYGAGPEPETANVDKERDELEVELIRSFMAAGKPVFGICRGIQILNVALGGGLIQHVPRWLGNRAHEEVHTPGTQPTASHAVTFTRNTVLGRALSSATTVNSFHHQSIAPDRLATGLTVVCVSPSGVIEAIESTRPVPHLSAVQWHPERLPTDHPASRDLLRFWAGVVGG